MPKRLLSMLSSAVAARPATLSELPARRLNLSGNALAVDVEAGTIKGAAVMAVGPATGHPFDIDAGTVESLMVAAQERIAEGRRVTSRLGHHTPWNPEDGRLDPVAHTVAYFTRFYRDGDVVRGDIKFLDPTHKESRQLLLMAQEVPTEVGLSIYAPSYTIPGLDDRDVLRVLELEHVDFVGHGAAVRNGLLSEGPRGGAVLADARNPVSPSNPMSPRALALLAHLAGLAGVKADKASLESLDEGGRAAILAHGSDRDRTTYAMLSLDLGKEGEKTYLLAAGLDPEKPWVPKAAPKADDSNHDSTSAPEAAAAALSAKASAAGGLSAADVDRMVKERMDAALSRQQETQAIVALAEDAVAEGVTDANVTAAAMLADGLTLDQAKARIFDARAAKNPPMNMRPKPNIHVGEDLKRAAIEDAVSDALLLSAGMPIYDTQPTEPGELTVALSAGGKPLTRNPHEMAGEFAGRRFVDVAKAYLASSVPEAWRWDESKVAKCVLNPRYLSAVTRGRATLAAGQHAASDFGGIVSNTIGRLLQPAYEATTSTHDQFVQDRMVNNFKEVTFNRVSDKTLFNRVVEGGEYEYGTFRDGQDTAKILKYGRAFSLTWESMIDDDINILGEARATGEDARYFESDLFWELFLSNPVLGYDGLPLFDAARGNLNVGGAQGLTEDGLSQIEAAMMIQRTFSPQEGDAGRYMSIEPNCLIVPPALKTAADILIGSTVRVGGSNATPNPEFIQNLERVVEPRLQGGVGAENGSASRYYVAAKGRSGIPTAYRLRASFQPGVVVEDITEATTVDGQAWKARMMTGFKFTEGRVWQRQDGI